MRKRIIGLGLLGLVAGALVLGPTAALASSGDHYRSGAWGSAHYQLDVSRSDTGKIEADLNLTHAVNGQKWVVKMRDNGALFKTATRTVKDHEFEVKGYTPNRPGTDRIKVVAINKATGKTYTVRIGF